MSNKEWDLDNSEHLQELVHALVMHNLQWKTGDEHKEHRKSWEILQSYTKQYALKKQLKESIDTTKPFKIGHRVKSKSTATHSLKGQVIIVDGEYMTISVSGKTYIRRMDEFEFDTNDEDVPNKRIDCTEDTTYERCKRLEKVLKATVRFFLGRMSDEEHFKQWDKQKTLISGIECIYPKEKE